MIENRPPLDFAGGVPWPIGDGATIVDCTEAGLLVDGADGLEHFLSNSSLWLAICCAADRHNGMFAATAARCASSNDMCLKL